MLISVVHSRELQANWCQLIHLSVLCLFVKMTLVYTEYGFTQERNAFETATINVHGMKGQRGTK